MYSTQHEAKLRNVFRLEDNAQDLQEALKNFPNQVPRFEKKTDCIEYMKKHSGVSSNPDYPQLRHSITNLVTWGQIEQYLLPKLTTFNQMQTTDQSSPRVSTINRFTDTVAWSSQLPSGDVNTDTDKGHESVLSEQEVKGCQMIHSYLQSRLLLPIHQRLSSYSTLNTLKYLFHHMKFGILVSIRNNQLVVFCPFVNRDYENNWSEVLRVDGESVEAYYANKAKYYREESVMDMSKWWANGNIMCNEQGEQLWGDHFLLPLRDMLAETCRCREVADCDFFINKRDYPQLKYNTQRNTVVEPYGFIYDLDDKKAEEDINLSRHSYPSLAPILSFYTSERFADIPFPPSEDWEAATGEVFPPSMTWQPKPAAPDNTTRANGSGSGEDSIPKIRDLFTAENLKMFEKPWEDKKDVAFFRGTATGGGVTAASNQRLQVAVLSEEWSKDSKYKNYLDAKIVGWNMRDKKLAGKKMSFVHRSNFPFEVTSANFTPIYEQSSFKYLLYIEGHCAACRYGFMMVLGSVILKVESRCVADQLWYFPLLEPFVDHVPVKADLSDLAEQIEWCRANDDKCKEIAKRARVLHDRFLSKEGILDYMQMTLTTISSQWIRPLSCFQGDSSARPPPYDVVSDNRKHCLEIKGDPQLCASCEVRSSVMDKQIQAQAMPENPAKKTVSKRAAVDRMKERQKKKKRLDGP